MEGEKVDWEARDGETWDKIRNKWCGEEENYENLAGKQEEIPDRGTRRH